MLTFCDLRTPQGRLETYRHPTTGVLCVKYPLTWVGVSEYYLMELLPPGVPEAAARAMLPERWRDKSLRSIVRVLHRPEQVCDETFIRAAYGLPCIAVEHPAGFVHIERAPTRRVGTLGSSHEIRVVGPGEVPVLPSYVDCALTAARIEAGDNESSLGYRCAVWWAEPGETWNGLAYDAEHLFKRGDPRLGGVDPLPNHLVIAIEPLGSRGGERAAMLLDRGRRCYHRVMLIPCNDRARQALKVRDAALTIPDGIDPAAVETLKSLVAALETALADGDAAAARAGEAETSLAAATSEMQTLAEDAARGRQIARDAALSEAATLGVTIAQADVDKLTTAEAVHDRVVRAKLGTEALDKLPEGQRPAYIAGAMSMLRKAAAKPAGVTRQAGATVAGAADSNPQREPGAPSGSRAASLFFGQATPAQGK